MLYRLTGNCCTFGIPVDTDVDGRTVTLVRTAAEFRATSTAPLLIAHSWYEDTGAFVTVERQRDHLHVTGLLDSDKGRQKWAIDCYFAGHFRGLSMSTYHGDIEEVSLASQPRDKTTWVRLVAVG